MSSMFKKKGGLAFKPKIPLTRPQPAASRHALEVPKPVEKQIPNDPSIQLPTTDSTDSPASQRTSDKAVQPINTTSAETRVAIQTSISGIRQDAGNGNAVETTARTDSEEVSTPPITPWNNKPASFATGAALLSTTNATRSAVVPQGSVTVEQPSPESSETQPRELPHEDITSASTPAQSAETTTAESSVAEDDSAVVATADPPISSPTTKRKTRKPAVKKLVNEADGESNTAPKSKKRVRKSAQDGENASQPQPRKRKATATNGEDGRPKSRRARSLTPEDAEEQLVDLQKLRMADLTKDLHIGKKFSRHDELRERERKARLKAKLDKGLEPAEGEAVDSETLPGSAAQGGNPSNRPIAAAPAAPAPSGPQFRIVDGQIIVDQSSLVMDRHARAEAARAGQDMETIEENDFTRLITSSSFMNTSKLRGPNIWNDEETELFYHGLRMFGTDFEMISKMFRGKQRRNIKLKFNREERHNPKRIDAVLIGEKTIKINIEEYQTHTGSEFEPVEKIEAEHRERQDNFEAERQRVVDEQAEIMRKKKEELFADDDAGKKKKRGKKKQAISYGLNGEPIMAEG